MSEYQIDNKNSLFYLHFPPANRFFLKPVIAAILAIAFLGDKPTWLQVSAIAVVSGSVLFEIYWQRMVPGKQGTDQV